MLEVTWGLQVDDAEAYAAYRAAMTPVLTRMGGEFVLDVWVREVLRAPNDVRFNRLFTIRFPTPETLAEFFTHPDYLAVRAKHFEGAVSSVTELSRRSL